MHSPTYRTNVRFDFRLTGIALAAMLAVSAGAFAQAPTFNTLITTYKGGQNWAHPQHAAVGDFNGDGRLDAILTDGTNSLHVLLGNGNGAFADHELGISTMTGNGDVVGLPPQLTPYLPNPIDGFGLVKAADLNGDGKLDVICTMGAHINWGPYNFTTVLINTGNDSNGVPQFKATSYYSPNTDLRSLTVGDLNGDLRPDFIIGNAYGWLQVSLNNGDGTFTGGTPFSVQPSVGGAAGQGAIADVNGDGRADFVVTDNQAHATDIFYGNGNGTFGAPAVIANYAVSAALADVNDDGRPDLIEGYGDGTVTVSLNDGSAFGAPSSYSTVVNGGVSAIAVADMNGDGTVDLVVNNANSSNGVAGAAVLVGNGDGTFAAAAVYNVNQRPVDLAVGDFNGDGTPDIATVGLNDDTYGVLLNTTVIADTTAPVVKVVPGDQVVEASGPDGAVATFSATATDPDDAAQAVTCTWASGATFPLGTTNVVCSSTDTHHNTGTASFDVLVRDTTPPAISAVTPSQATIWAPNKKMVPISIAVTATDAVTASPTCQITSVASSEPGSGQSLVTGPLTVQLQADRLGTGNGRVYTIAVSCSDAAGNVSNASTTVLVPHDQRK